MNVILQIKPPLVILNTKVWEYLLNEDVKHYLNSLELNTYQIHRQLNVGLSQATITINFLNDNDAIMFKLLFGEHL